MLSDDLSETYLLREPPLCLNLIFILQISPGDCGWDVFSLDYHVDGPISTVSAVVLFTNLSLKF